MVINYLTCTLIRMLPSVLWRCWLGGRKGIWPVKTEQWGAGVVICLEQDADLHLAQLMPLPLTVSCFSKIQIGSTFLVPAHLGSPGKRAVKWVCVCVCVYIDKKTQTVWYWGRKQTFLRQVSMMCNRHIFVLILCWIFQYVLCFILVNYAEWCWNPH